MLFTTDLPIAANTWIWHCPLTDAEVPERIGRLAEWGFDAVEMPLENIGDWDPDVARECLENAGMASLVGSVMAPGRELGAASSETIESTKHYIKACIDHAQRQGSPIVIGPLTTSVGRTWRMSADERRRVLNEVRDNLADLADYAGSRGIVLGIEPLNRYETSLCNTSEQIMELLDPLPSETIGVNLDTYHMNIEESDMWNPVLAAGDKLVYVHIGESHRGYLGTGSVDFDGLFRALGHIGYTGPIAFESFSTAVVSDELSRSLAIWRNLWEDNVDLGRHAYEFITGKLRSVETIAFH